MRFFRILFAFDALAVLVLAYFFVDGLQYSPSADYLTIWLFVLGLPIGFLVGALNLHGKGKKGAAIVLLVVLAAPVVLFIAFFGLLLALQPNWH